MDILIRPHALEGSVDAIASKSMAHRLLTLAALCPNRTDLNCNTTSKDIEATAGCLEALGAHVARTRVGFRVNPIGAARGGATLDCGESGSTLRFLLPVAAALGCGASFTGHGRLAQRPLSPLYEELQAHGVKLSAQGSFPLTVSGELEPGDFFIPGNVSSQYISGLLMAAPLMDARTRVFVGEPVESRSYVNITIKALETFGVHVSTGHEERKGRPCTVYEVDPSRRLASPSVATVEGDWSNSAFWLAAGAMANSVEVDGLDMGSTQGDRAIMAALAAYGATVRRGSVSATCVHDRLEGRTIDVSDIPDLVPPLAAVACLAEGTTKIVGAARLRLKESDRLATVSDALGAMGADISIEGDGLEIQGGRALAGGVVDAANDHRIAMMAAVAGASATGETLIRGAECVSKSYPGFFDDYRKLGGIAEERDA